MPILPEHRRLRRREPIQQALDHLLAEHLPALLHHALANPGGGLPDLLDRGLQTAPQPEQAANLFHLLPQYSTALAALAFTLIQQAVHNHHHKQQQEALTTSTPGRPSAPP